MSAEAVRAGTATGPNVLGRTASVSGGSSPRAMAKPCEHRLAVRHRARFASGAVFNIAVPPRQSSFV